MIEQEKVKLTVEIQMSHLNLVIRIFPTHRYDEYS